MDKCYNCTIENSHTIVNSVEGGRGYALGNMAFHRGIFFGNYSAMYINNQKTNNNFCNICLGCYQWRFYIEKNHKDNEGTCVGISKWPVNDYNYRTTNDMWLYRAYR